MIGKNCYVMPLLVLGGIACTMSFSLERFSADQLRALANKKSFFVGIVTNQTGVQPSGERTIDYLMRNGIELKKIFAPEHGLDGAVGAGATVCNDIDAKTRLPITSLYAHGKGKEIVPAHFKGLHGIVFDIQDSGMRHYTYVSTLVHLMKALAKTKISLIVIDRPNPLGRTMEGPLVAPGYTSFISAAPVPLRHGMTLGEIAFYCNKRLYGNTIDVQVMPIYQFDQMMSIKKIVPLSPNIRTRRACTGYSFLGLLGEISPFDTGLDTAHSMSCFALPDDVSPTPYRWQQLAQTLEKLGLKTTPIRYKSPRKKSWCQGLQLANKVTNDFSSCEVLIAIVQFAQQMKVPLTFSKSFDLAVGTDKLRNYLERRLPRVKLADAVNKDLTSFYREAETSFLYKPHPILVKSKESVAVS